MKTLLHEVKLDDLSEAAQIQIDLKNTLKYEARGNFKLLMYKLYLSDYSDKFTEAEKIQVATEFHRLQVNKYQKLCKHY
jgi:hypothetical protein